MSKGVASSLAIDVATVDSLLANPQPTAAAWKRETGARMYFLLLPSSVLYLFLFLYLFLYPLLYLFLLRYMFFSSLNNLFLFLLTFLIVRHYILRTTTTTTTTTTTAKMFSCSSSLARSVVPCGGAKTRGKMRASRGRSLVPNAKKDKRKKERAAARRREMKSRPSLGRENGEDGDDGEEVIEEEDASSSRPSSATNNDPNQRILENKEVFFQSMTLASTYKQRTDLQLLGDQKVPVTSGESFILCAICVLLARRDGYA